MRSLLGLYPRSIRGRLTLAAVAVSGVFLLIVSAAASMVVENRIREDLTEQAARASRHITTSIDQRRFPGNIIPDQGDVVRLQLVNRSGDVVAASPAMSGKPPMLNRLPARGDSQVTGEACIGGSTCLYVVGTSDRATAYGPVVAYAGIRAPSFLGTAVVPLTVAGVSILLLTLVGFGTWYVVGRVLRPVERMRAGMAAITASDLHQRVPVPKREEELTKLANTMNETLARLEEAAERQRRFVSDASHELRTPITGLLTRLELTLAQPEQDELLETLQCALHDTERLKELVSDLLILARLDSGVRPPEEEIDLGRLVGDELERRFNRLTVTTGVTPGLIVRGNRIRLIRALTNLMANAEQYGNERVHVSVTRADDEAVLEVRDDGPGISPEGRQRIFERFTRLDGARSRDAGGTGLGLAIVHEIAASHGGRIFVGDDDGAPGARMIVRLPLARTAARAPGIMV